MQVSVIPTRFQLQGLIGLRYAFQPSGGRRLAECSRKTQPMMKL